MLRLRISTALAGIQRAAWDALDTGDNPFVGYRFLEGLERHGCIRSDLGWTPCHFTLWRDAVLVAAAPAYLKGNSHGEFVFDHSWAEAHARIGLAYYPKLLVAVPYSPVPGPRLLVRPDEPESTRVALAAALVAEAARRGLSSAHVNFAGEQDSAAFEAGGWLARHDWQFHWHHRGYADFDGFLNALNAKRRKEIRRERRRFEDPRWHFQWRSGDELDAEEIDFVHACYARAFSEKGNHPALTRGFFAHLAAKQADNVNALIVREHGERVAMAFFLRSRDALYGRYWGAQRYVPALHFECCYYRGIEHCIANGIARFEPGAQGEHKLARGFMPALTRSWHWIAEPRLREAIARSLERERAWLAGYRDSLLAHTPYTAAADRPDPSP